MAGSQTNAPDPRSGDCAQQCHEGRDREAHAKRVLDGIGRPARGATEGAA